MYVFAVPPVLRFKLLFPHSVFMCLCVSYDAHHKMLFSETILTEDKKWTNKMDKLILD